MTVLAYGDRMEVIESLRERFGTRVAFIRLGGDQRRDPEEAPRDLDVELMRAWSQKTIPRKHLVFIDPPKGFSPKKRGLVNQPDRHVVFDQTPVSAAWKTWAATQEAELVAYETDAKAVLRYLIQGDSEKGVPAFTPEAALHFTASNPGGFKALATPLAILEASEAQAPINLETVTALWPLSLEQRRVYAVPMATLRRLGSQETLQALSGAPEDESIPTLSILKSTCKYNLHRVEWIESALKGMRDKVWTPKAALMLVGLSCLEETQCPSPSSRDRAKARSSALLRLKIHSQLSNTPFWLT